MAHKKYFTADEAIHILGISKGTLYSYVSRGMVRSEEGTDGTRARRYLAEDVNALKRRKEQRRNPGSVATGALHFGDPVLESAITLIEEGRLYYRGVDAIGLAKERRFEEVATLLWTGSVASMAPFHGMMDGRHRAGRRGVVDAQDGLRRYQTMMQQNQTLRPIEAFQALLPSIATEDLAAYDLSPLGIARTGSHLLTWMVAMVTDAQRQGSTIAECLQQAWVPARPEAIDLLNGALILCADHELNVSSFTVRCIASAGSTPYAAVGGGLAALQGPRHGGDTERVASLFQEAKGGARLAVGTRLKQGQKIPGFGHPLYPDGDPRGRFLLDKLGEIDPAAPAYLLAKAIQREVRESIDVYPTVDFGLVALAQVLALPPSAPLTLFAISRTAGWIGHLIEQYQSERLIRPRARYVGVRPS